MSAINSKINFLLITAGAFFGGLATGFLLAPRPGRENLKWIRDKQGHIVDWVNDKGNLTGRKVHQFTNNIEKSVHDTLPDLYSATENFDLKDEDLMN